MKKRLLCLTLGIIMMLSVCLVGCSTPTGTEGEGSGVEGIEIETKRKATTLTMYLITEEGTSPEEIAKVEEEFNKIVEGKFKTRIKFRMYTEDLYYQAVEEAIENTEKAAEEAKAQEKAEKRRIKELKESFKKAGLSWVTETAAETTEAPEETTMVKVGNAYISELAYPAAGENQVDILFIGNYEKFAEYNDNGWLARLNEELNGNSKKLKAYVNSKLLESIKDGSSYYAIPNNVVVGDYTYLLVNKELAAKYSYDSDDFKTFTDETYVDFLNDIKKYETDVQPIFGDIEPVNLYYWSVDKDTLELKPSQFSVLAANMSSDTVAHSPISVSHLTSSSYVTQMRAIKTFQENGFIGYDASKPFASAVIKGDAGDVAQYSDDYYLNIIEYPRANETELYGSMFAVSDLTSDVSRCMEVITYLNTNSDLRNILQYGVEGDHYRINETTNALERLRDDYQMDINKTGNVFVAYPEEGMPLDAWDYGKAQNRQTLTIPTAGFRITKESNLDMDMLERINELSEKYYTKIKEAKTVAEFESVIEALNIDFKDPYIQKAINPLYVLLDETDTQSLYTLWFSWLVKQGYVAAPEL